MLNGAKSIPVFFTSDRKWQYAEHFDSITLARMKKHIQGLLVMIESAPMKTGLMAELDDAYFQISYEELNRRIKKAGQ